MNNDHILSTFDNDLNRLNKDLLKLAKLATEQFVNSIDNFSTQNIEEIDKLIANDKNLDDLDEKIQQLGFEIIALRAPQAEDLRRVISALKISTIFERIGDYCKNLFEIAETGNTFTKGDDLDDYIELRNDIGKLIVYLQSCLNLDDESKVQDLITLGSSLNNDLDEKITALLEDKEKIQYPVATTLFYRYLKRIVSHIINAATAIIMPTDQIDYLDE